MVGGPETKSQILNAVSTPMETIQEAVANSAAAMPSAASATNVVTATLNRVINSNVSAPASAAGAAPNSFFGNAKKNMAKSPNLPGLGFKASNV